jgi:hypothetical protein
VAPRGRANASLLDLEPLARELSPRVRAELRQDLGALLRFHAKLGRFPRVRGPRATPIVAVYAGGALRGCAVWRGGGTGGERLARAFLGATASLAGELPLAAQVFYARDLRWLRSPAELDAGREGIAAVYRGGPVLLMPQVARDHGVDGPGMAALLAEKAGGLPRDARLVAWTVDSVTARTDDVEQVSARAAARTGADAGDYAAAWLARMIDARGQVAFALDARNQVLQPSGPLWHARSAVAIEALAAHGGNATAVARARRWLGAEIERGLAGARVDAWPEDRATVLGTLALARLAGVRVHDRLQALVAGWRGLVRSPAWPWHAGQVACALGRATPPALWSWCVADLARHPFAPYTALAARTIGDERTLRVATAALAPFIRRTAPFRGGASATELPETALTAVAAHALAGTRHATDAFAFVRAHQLLPGRIPAALDPALALGAFRATPVDDTLRADITGHALLALRAAHRP